jgi:Fe-S cluster assembly protein SufD
MSFALAIRTRDLNALPSRRDEDWRWSDLRSVLAVLPPPSPADAAAAPNPALADLAGETALYVNGHAAAPAGPGASGRLIRRFVSCSSGAAHHLDVSLDIAPGERLVLIDSFEGQGRAYLASAAGRIRIGTEARLERIVFLDDADDAVSVSKFEVELGQGAHFSQTVLASGAKRQRAETRVRQSGGSELRLDGIYLLAGHRHSDQTTAVVHEGLGGKSTQLVKGLAADQARGVFQGRIVVAEGADGTDARMGSHAILLSDGAEIDAKPELEIYADDVQCAHGATVGALDPEALFYACSRGLPLAEATAMLAAGFVAAVADRIEDEAAQTAAQAWVSRQLAGLL